MHSPRDALFLAGVLDGLLSAVRDIERARKRLQQLEVKTREVYNEVLDEEGRIDNTVASSREAPEDEDELPF